MTEPYYKPLFKLPDHMEEYISKGINKENNFEELFQASPEDIELKTDLMADEVILLNKIQFNTQFLNSKGLGSPYLSFLDGYQRKLVSLDRKSRGEFVDVNKRERFEQNLKKFGEFQNLNKVKE